MTPNRTTQQREDALANANKVRMVRAAWKREARQLNHCDGVLLAITVLQDPEPSFITMKVTDLLCSVRKFGPYTVRQLLGSLAISERKTVGGLTHRQKHILLTALKHHINSKARTQKQEVISG